MLQVSVIAKSPQILRNKAAIKFLEGQHDRHHLQLERLIVLIVKHWQRWFFDR